MFQNKVTKVTKSALRMGSHLEYYELNDNLMPFVTFSHTEIVQMFLGSLCSVAVGQQTSTSKLALFFWPKVTFVVLWHLLSLACLPPFSAWCSLVGIWSLDSVLSTLSALCSPARPPTVSLSLPTNQTFRYAMQYSRLSWPLEL